MDAQVQLWGTEERHSRPEGQALRVPLTGMGCRVVGLWLP